MCLVVAELVRVAALSPTDLEAGRISSHETEVRPETVSSEEAWLETADVRRQCDSRVCTV